MAGRRRIRLFAAAVAVLVAVGVGVLVTARAMQSPPTNTPTTEPVSTPIRRPILPFGPPIVRCSPCCRPAVTCGPDPARPAAATAALRCGAGPAGGPDTAEFVRFGDVATLDRTVADVARRRQLPLDTSSCRDGAAIQTTWSKNGQVAGLLACYADPTAGRTLRWTDRGALAMGVITRADGNSAALYDWWTRYDFAR